MMIQVVWPFVHRLTDHARNNVLNDPLSAIAIFVGLFGIWRAEELFRKLDHTLEDLGSTIKVRTLDSIITVTCSYSAFRRALQAVEILPGELSEDAAFALFTTFHFQTQRFDKAGKEELVKLRKDTRAKVDSDARDYVQMLLSGGIACKKPGFEFADTPPWPPGHKAAKLIAYLHQ
jgi:hypothetical protein